MTSPSAPTTGPELPPDTTDYWNEVETAISDILKTDVTEVLQDVRKWDIKPQFADILRDHGVDSGGSRIVTVGTWLEVILEQALQRSFDPGALDRGNRARYERYEDQFAVYAVKVRVKSADSAADSIHVAWASKARVAADERETRHDRTDASARCTDFKEHLDKLKNGTACARERFIALMQVCEDLVGARAVVLCQRPKMNIVRGLNLLMQAGASYQFLTDNPDEPADGMVRLHLQGRKFRSHKAAPWKFFNPPASFLYSTPDVVQRFSKAVTGLGTSDLATQEHMQSDKAVAVAAVFAELDHYGIQIVHRPSGYASFQRVFTVTHPTANPPGYELTRDEFCFELQVRTILEDAFAEPEHRLVYKPGKPMSESTKVLFRNYGAGLTSADDLLQVIADRRQEETDTKQPLNQHSITDYQRKDRSFPNLKGIGRDLRKVYNLRDEGHLSTALGFLRRAIEDLEQGVPRTDHSLLKELREALAVLRAEYAYTLCLQKTLYVPGAGQEGAVPQNYLDADQALDIALKDAEGTLSETFLLGYRRTFVRWLKARYGFDNRPDDIGLEGHRSEFEEIATAVAQHRSALAKPLAQLTSDGDVLRDARDQDKVDHVSVHEPNLFSHIRTEYNARALQYDIRVLEQNCRLHAALCMADKDARNRALRTVVRACRDMRGQIVGVAGATGQGTNVMSAVQGTEFFWTYVWCSNILVYAAASMDDPANDVVTDATGEAVNDLHQVATPGTTSVFIQGDAYVTGPFETDDAEKTSRNNLQGLVDDVALEPLKVLDTLMLWRLNDPNRQPANGQDLRIKRVFGMIRHRLIEIAYLADFGWERGFFGSVTRNMQRAAKKATAAAGTGTVRTAPS